MNFSAQERKLVERLRKQERQWRVTRWLLLIMGVGIAAAWSWLLWYTYKLVGADREGVSELLLALAYPKVLFGLMVAAGMVGFALRDWWGHPTRLLLLKLIDELDRRDVASEEKHQHDAPQKPNHDRNQD